MAPAEVAILARRRPVDCFGSHRIFRTGDHRCCFLFLPCLVWAVCFVLPFQGSGLNRRTDPGHVFFGDGLNRQTTLGIVFAQDLF